MMTVALKGSITVSWSSSDLASLNFVEDKHKDKALNDIYISAGHSPNMMSIGLLQEHRILPEWALNIRDGFSLRKTAATIHKIKPGHYLPLHHDLYTTYKKINNIIDEDIYRLIVFLEDWKPGHMLDIDGIIYNQWRAGDYVGWTNATLHAAYNLGTEDRYTLQITGIA